MHTHLIIFHIVLTLCLTYVVSQANVEFTVPNILHKNVPYKLIIQNDNPGAKFPVESFAIVLELLKTVTPRDEISVADVSSKTYTGDEYRGFSIKDCKFNINSIEMSVEFRREAHGATFRIRYASAKTDYEKEEFYGTNPNTGVIFTKSINMLLPYTITILVSPDIRAVTQLDREAIGHNVFPNLNGQISCQATNGLPNAKPRFSNSESLKESTVNIVNNDAIKLVWPVSILDHGKSIHCEAGQDVNTTIINVYHYMTAVVSSPPIIKKVSQGARMMCKGNNGYPLPNTEWVFLSGPPEASKYYELLDNNATLVINFSAPLNSKWAFVCRGSHKMPFVARKYLKENSPYYPISRTYNFSIMEPMKPVVQSSSAGMIAAIIILFILIIALLVLVVKYKAKLVEIFNRWGQRKSNQSTKIPQKSGVPDYQYKGMKMCDNGTDKDDDTPYLEIVGTVQPKSNQAMGPIHRV